MKTGNPSAQIVSIASPTQACEVKVAGNNKGPVVLWASVDDGRVLPMVRGDRGPEIVGANPETELRIDWF